MLTESHEAGITETSSPAHAPPALIVQQPPLASWTSRAKALTVDWLMLLVPAVLLFVVLVVPELKDTHTPDGHADYGEWAAAVMFLALMQLVGIVWASVLAWRYALRAGSFSGT